MSKISNNKYISVLIPTYNGEKYLAECIEAVINQEIPDGYNLELIVIDSGSKDGTLDILRTYEKKLILIEIPNSEFSHGGTRSKGAKMARGEFILFLTQDATPASYRWLKNMIEPFFVSDKVGCVFGRQIPRHNAAVTIKREVATAFGALGAPDSIILHRSRSLVDNKEMNAFNTFFSDANSAVRRNLLIGEVPFRNVHYAEDQALAQDMQQKGYLKAYVPQGAVWHSNDYNAHEYFMRKFDEFIGLQESLGTVFSPSKKDLLFGWIRPTFRDYKYIFKDKDYNARSKIKGIIKAPFFNLSLVSGKYYASKYYNNPEERKKLSLESKLRS